MFFQSIVDQTLNMPVIVDSPTFRSAIDELLREEKESTRVRDALAQKRRNLPAVKVENAFSTAFTAADGSTVTFPELFEGRKQLVIYQFMIYDDDKEGCNGCSFCMDHVPHLGHLHSRDTTFAVIAPAPIAKINAFRERMGWRFPFYSCKDTFANDNSPEAKATWRNFAIAVFARDGEDVINTYGTDNRGVEPILSTYGLLDMTLLGRQDVGAKIGEFKHHDKY